MRTRQIQASAQKNGAPPPDAIGQVACEVDNADRGRGLVRLMTRTGLGNHPR